MTAERVMVIEDEADILEVIDGELERLGEGEFASDPRKQSRPIPRLTVIDGDQETPFSRGLLARSIAAAGLGLDRSYRLAHELESEVLEDAVGSIPRPEVARRVGELI